MQIWRMGYISETRGYLIEPQGVGTSTPLCQTCNLPKTCEHNHLATLHWAYYCQTHNSSLNFIPHSTIKWPESTLTLQKVEWKWENRNATETTTGVVHPHTPLPVSYQLIFKTNLKAPNSPQKRSSAQVCCQNVLPVLCFIFKSATLWLTYLALQPVFS
jgi:hypothetical protein